VSRVQLGRRAFVRQLAGLGAVTAGLAIANVGCDRLPIVSNSRIARIGILSGTSIGGQDYWLTGPAAGRFHRFVDGLRELGWIEGKNLEFEWASGEGHNDRLPALAADLVRRADVIVSGESPAIQAAIAASAAVPIVMTSIGDPVGSGLVASLAQPGGNVTGVTQLVNELVFKRLELLKAALPSLSTVVILFNGSNFANAKRLPEILGGAAALGVQAFPWDLHSPDEDLSSALTAAAPPSGADGLLLSTDGLFNAIIDRIVGLAAQARVPAMYFAREYVDAGGLMAYGPNLAALYYRSAYFVDRVLRGASPADLPVEQPTVFEFLVNVHAAESLGFTIPASTAVQVTEWV
jgi:putative tryptophan/tyrosine transport system substrate-binding protein